MDEKQIPKQEHGGSSDTTAKAEFDTETAAKEAFEVSKKRLLDINRWKEISVGKLTAFQIFDENGEEQTVPEEGYFLRIGIPGPRTVSGNGYDWVRIKSIVEEYDEDSATVSIKVKPAPAPVNNDKADAHFFDDDATSTFVVQRKGKTVTAEVHGRNEKANNEEPGIIDSIRNTVVAIGAKLFGSKMQWKSLVEGIIARDDEMI